MTTFEILSVTMSGIALIVSLVVALWNLIGHFRKFQISVIGKPWFVREEGNSNLFLIRLALVNPAILPRIAYQLQFRSPEGYLIHERLGQYNVEKGTVVFRNRAGEKEGWQTRISDVLDFPVDIEPHHSRIGYIFVEVSMPPGEQKTALVEQHRQMPQVTISVLNPHCAVLASVNIPRFD